MSFGGGSNHGTFNASGFSLAPSAVGDIILLEVVSESTSDYIDAISSGNVTWSTLVAATTVGSDKAIVFIGEVTSTSSEAVTLSFNTGSSTFRGHWAEFTTTAGYSNVALDTHGTVSSSTLDFPDLSPGHGSGELYWGFALWASSATAGSTSGYTYFVDGTNDNGSCWNTSCGSGAQEPVWGGSAEAIDGIAVLLYETTEAFTATATLTETPTLTADRVHAATAQAALTVTPVETADATAGLSATAVLTETPVFTANPKAAQSAQATLSVAPVLAAVTPTLFPANPLPVKLEMLINGTWEDVSAYLQERSDIQVTRGLPNETQALTPSSLTFTLNNRDGRFSTNNSSGAYYPYMTRGIECRLSVANAASSTGALYTGYRFWGEVSDIPPTWDVTGNDVYVNVTVSGPFRRYVQSPNTGSPMALALEGLTGDLACVALWPCEDGQYASQLSSALPGGSAITYVSGTPDLAAETPMEGATLPLPEINGSQWHGVIPSYTSNGSIVVRFMVNFANDVTTGNEWPLVELYLTGGPVSYLQFLMYDQSDYSNTLALGLIGFESNGSTQVFNSGAQVEWNEHSPSSTNSAFWCSLEIQEVAGKVQYSMVLLAAGASGAVGYTAPSQTGSVGTITDIYINPYTEAINGTALGMISVQSYWETMYNYVAQLSAFAGETAAERLQRLCTQNNLNFTLVGSDTTPQMGPQQIDTLLNMMQSCMDMDRGILYESKTQLGVEYRTRESMQNQDAALSASYTDSVLSQVPAPTADDQFIRNYVTMTQDNGGSATVQLASGAMSVQYPPDGIGPYSYQQTVIAYSDTQLPSLATWVMAVGTVNEYRFPQLTFDMERTEVAGLFATIPAVDIGDFIQVTNPPAFLQPGAINQLAWGYNETLNNFYWIIAFNTVPEDPYTGEDLPSW
jgi:hypothetical protein